MTQNPERPIWFDIDNAPHINLFLPLIRHCQAQGIAYLVTARNRRNIPHTLLEEKIPFIMVGGETPGSMVAKFFRTFQQAALLAKVAILHRPRIAVSHGSRPQLIAAKLTRVPSILFMDFEFCERRVFNLLADKICLPQCMKVENEKHHYYSVKKSIYYSGIKEHVYLKKELLNQKNGASLDLEISPDSILTVFRPPARDAHYNRHLKEDLVELLYRQLLGNKLSVVLCIPRNKTDTDFARKMGSLGLPGKLMVLDHWLPVLPLLKRANLCVSGGGTLIREAAVLGRPALSIFPGKIGSVDSMLAKRGIMQILKTPEEINTLDISKVPVQSPYFEETTFSDWLGVIGIR